MHVKRHLAAAMALALGLAAAAGSALAAPPSTPPGQEKKAEAAATANPAENAKSEKAETKSTGIDSTESGVKPSESTKKHTSCETGGSMPTPSCTETTSGSVSTSSTSDHSKRYGNGTTAAQIAVGRDAPAGTEIRGPGNSQPHKVCGKNGNWVDVHAVKSYVGVGVCSEASSTTTPTSSSTTTATTTSSTTSTSTSVAGTAAVTGQTAGSTAAGGAAGSTPASGGVAGAQGVAGGAGGEAGGVAGAFAEIGGVAAGTLPFTGLPLWAMVLIALAAVAIGVTLVHRSRPLTTRDVV
jgi:hypothetical protein